jgi:hypothetical protein
MNRTNLKAIQDAIDFLDGSYEAHKIRKALQEALAQIATEQQPAQEASEQAPCEQPVAWMPIETAPKDNKRALYLAKFDMDGKLVELDFDAEWVYEEESWEMSHINYWYWRSNTGIEEPTHWAYQDEPIPPYKQPAQEPVGYIEPADLESVPDGDTGLWFAKQDERYSIPIYTHPAQPWQGLTDDEVLAIPVGSRLSTAHAIEQELKEKNT